MVLSQGLIARYKALKAKVPDCILLMHVGVFMQVLDDDARVLSQVSPAETVATMLTTKPSDPQGTKLSTWAWCMDT